jgi:APA family basic amino acid/polyamine antiporter
MLMTMSPFVDLLLYIGFLLNVFAVLSVASLFKFRKRDGWRKLKVVSFAYPLIPVFFCLVGVGMTIFGLTYKPGTAAIAILTVIAGAIVYHFRIQRRTA